MTLLLLMLFAISLNVLSLGKEASMLNVNNSHWDSKLKKYVLNDITVSPKDELNDIIVSPKQPSLPTPKASTPSLPDLGPDAMETSSSDDMMGMGMTFSSFSEYKLTLLFSWIKITDVWQFVVVWCGVFLVAILYHYMKFWTSNIEAEILGERKAAVLFGDLDDINESTFINKSAHKKYRKITPTNDEFSLRLMHCLLVGVNYCISLLLMLVAMTYNSLLFIALILGYTTGDFLFFRIKQAMFMSEADCH